MIKVSIIIVGWNHRVHVLKCIQSIQEQNCKSVEIIYIDNASADGTTEEVKHQFPGVQIIANPHNIGFCKANNQGFAVARGEYIFQLNPDTVLDAQCIPLLMAYLQVNPHVGICGPKMLLDKNPSTINSLGMTINQNGTKTHIGLGDQDNPNLRPDKVPFLSGAALFMRKSLIEKIGGLDENLFAYADDTEICLRAWSNGFECHLVPGAKLYHVRNAGAKNSSEYAKLARYYAIRNHHYPYWKFFPLKYLLGLLPTMLQYRLKYLWKGMKKLIGQKRPNPELRASFWCIILFLKAISARPKNRLSNYMFRVIFPDFQYEHPLRIRSVGL